MNKHTTPDPAEVKNAATAESFMRSALKWAHRAARRGEVPVGCVIVKNGEIVAHGYNRREMTQDPTEHAEMMAIRKAAAKLGSWRLEDCEIYVTLEPCFMCAAALQQARIPRIYFGARDPKAGALVSQGRHFEEHVLNHKAEVIEGILAEDCSRILKDFFRVLRAENRLD